MTRLRYGTTIWLAASLALAGGCSSGDDPAPPPAGGLFVAVGEDGTILTSSDGSQWARASSPTDADLWSVAFGRSMVVAVGARGTILSSGNGADWTVRSAGGDTDMADVIFTGEKFVAVGGSWNTGSAVQVSADGVSWQSVDTTDSYMFHAVAHTGSSLVAAAYLRSDLQLPALFVAGASSTGAWSEGMGPDFYDSVNVDGTALTVGGTQLNRSTDGVTWTTTNLPVHALVSGIAFGGSQYVVVGELGVLYTSGDDGATWTRRVSPLGDEGWFGGVAYGGGVFVAVGSEGIARSADGASWLRATTSSAVELTAVAHAAWPTI